MVRSTVRVPNKVYKGIFMQNATIKNLWKNTTVLCDTDHKILELVPSRKGYVYECPICKKSISIAEYEKILDKICLLDSQRFEENAEYSLRGEKFKIMTNQYEILKESEVDGKWEVNAKIY